MGPSTEFSDGVSPGGRVRGIVGAMGQLFVEEAFEKWGDDLMGYATVLVGADDAADVVSDAFVSLLASRRWDGVSDQRGYLFRCVLNAARMHHRGRKRRLLRETRSVEQAVTTCHDEPSLVDEIRRLSPRQSSVVYLTYWEGLSPTQVAQTLGIAEGSVRRHLARARKNLRKILSSDV